MNLRASIRRSALALVAAMVLTGWASRTHGDPNDPASPDAYIMPVRPLVPPPKGPIEKKIVWKLDDRSGIRGVDWPANSSSREHYVRGPAEWTLQFEGDRDLVVLAREAECERASDRATKIDRIWFQLVPMTDDHMESFLDAMEQDFVPRSFVDAPTGREMFRKWKDEVGTRFQDLIVRSDRNFPSISLHIKSSRQQGKWNAFFSVSSIEPMLPETQIAAFEAVEAGNCDEALRSIESCPEAPWERYVPSGDTVLHEAAKQGCLPVIEQLTKAGVSVDQRDESGDTPLAEAFLAGRLDVAEALLAMGADVSAKQAGERTILHIVAERDAYALPQTQLIAWALERGVDPARRMHDGETALDLAVRRKHVEAIRLLQDANKSTP